MNVVEMLLWRTLVLFLMLGGSAGLILGAMMIWRPDRLQAINRFFSAWVSTRHIDRALEQSVEFDPWIYRNHRLAGLLILLASIYILYVFAVGLDRASAIAVFSRHFELPAALTGVLLDALTLTALIGGVFAAFVALFLLQRPSMLREFEQRANRWVSLRRALKPAEIQRKNFDELAFSYARQTGVFLLLGGLYTLLLLGQVLGRFA